jgi:two-component system sensor histidine kinase PilS (NtrC family)
MKSGEFTIKSWWFLSIRLTTYVLISGIVIFWMGYPGFLSFPYFAYSFLTLLLPVILILNRWIEVKSLLRVIPFLQTIFEIIVETGIIYATGNILSAFSGLFILTIISAAPVSNLAGILGIASIVSVSYAFVSWFGLAISGEPGSATRALETIFSTQDAAFYNIFLHILTFYLVAFISGFLVERLKYRDIQLASASKALRQARLDTDDILRHLHSGLLTIDRDGRIIFFNQAAEMILGYAESAIKGRYFRDVFAKRMPQLGDNLNDVLQSLRRLPRDEINIINSSGKNIPLGISTSLLLDENDEERGVIAIFQDLTETKQLEEKIRMADRLAAIGELSAAIAHEIRNPLAAISGSVEVLRADLDVEGQNKRLLDLIVKESSRLNNILSDFLIYARTNRSVFSRIELCHLVSDVFEVIRRHPSYKSFMTLKLSSAEPCMYVFGDEDKIKQILINLVINACEAINGDRGEVLIDIRQSGEQSVIMEVIDNGSGIDGEDFERIFNPFFSTKKDGTGLGLAIVQRLSENLNINLQVKTKAGVGTVFILQFNQIPEGLKSISREKSKQN